MSKATQSMVSEKNPFWIPKNRYYELKYFCLQFWEWKKRLAELDGLATRANREPTESEAMERLELSRKIEMVKEVVHDATHPNAPSIENALLLGITKGRSYDVQNAHTPIPVCREAYYAVYRMFFWILDRARE